MRCRCPPFAVRPPPRRADQGTRPLDKRVDTIVEDATLPADCDLLGPTVAAVAVAGPVRVGVRV